MNKRDTEECLKRANECARQADAAVEPELKIYLMKLALSWTQAAGETVERELFHMDIFDSHGLRAAMAQAP
jgi:hypothetical protein